MEILLIFNYFILISIFHFQYIKSEIIFVYENARHGIRGSFFTNLESYNNETFYDRYKVLWRGNGDLTLRGKIQQYILGIRNRFKYPNLINYEKFNENELLIHVTNTSRAKESAYNQLLGMFNPYINISKNEKLENKIQALNKYYYPPNLNIWKTYSDNIYSKIINEAELSIKLIENKGNKNFLTEGQFDLKENNEKYDMNFSYSFFPENRTFYLMFHCLNSKKYAKHNYENKFIEIIKEKLEKKYGNKLQSFFNYEKKEWLYNLRNAIMIIDGFLSNYYNERNMQKFFEETGIDKEEYHNICLYIYEFWLYNIYCDKKTCILESQKLMEDLIGYMDNKIYNKNSNLNMVIDLGHDFIVVPMQLFMHEVFDVEYSVTYFSCNIFFELHKEKDSENKEQYIVKYFVDDELRLNIEYELFKNKVNSKFWTEKEKDEFCNGNILKVIYPRGFIFFSILIITILFGLSILILYKCYNNLEKKKIKNKLLKNIGKKKNIKENDDNDKEIELV